MSIIFFVFFILMHTAIDFDNEFGLLTKEIGNKALDNLLTTKFEPAAPAIP